MNIVLCGMMGAGKTEIGKRLSFITGRERLDTDELIIERFGAIEEIFSRFGERDFREKEEKIIAEISQKGGMVISTGGGAFLREKNVENLQKNGKIVYLRAKKETLLERLSLDKSRPLLKGEKNLESKLERLLLERTPIYERVSDFILDVDGYSAKENTERVILLLQGAGLI